MATSVDQAPLKPGTEATQRRFFRTMAMIMSAIIIAGFTANLAKGISTFAVPLAYHIHAIVFFGWVVLYLAQNWLIAANNIRLHRTLGLLAYVWTPAMVAMGLVVLVTSLRRNGGPFFFDQNEFLFSNSMLLVLFGAMVLSALQCRRYTGWHRRLMLTAMSILTGPGLGRLLPMPLLMPNAWRIVIAITLVFPLIGMIADKRRLGHVHAAWFWGVGAIVLVQVVADLIAYSAWGVSLTQSLLEGTPGGQRPMAAFLPPGLAPPAP
jgi:hypothetical protein